MESTDTTAPVAMLAAVMGHPDGWATILESMAEHPELGPRSVLALASYKLDHPGADTSVILSGPRAEALGGTIVAGAAGFEILAPSARRIDDGTLTLDGSFEPETVYPGVFFTGLKNWPGAAPIKVVEGDAGGMDAILVATRDVNLEGMDPMASHVTLKRYGVDDGAKIEVPLVDTDILLAKIESVCAEVRTATDRIDRALKKAGYAYRPRAQKGNVGPHQGKATYGMTTKRLKNMLASIDSGRRPVAGNARKGA